MALFKTPSKMDKFENAVFPVFEWIAKLYHQFLWTTKNVSRSIVGRLLTARTRELKKNEFYAFMCRTSVEFLHEHIFQDCTLEHNMNLGKDISSGF